MTTLTGLVQWFHQYNTNLLFLGLTITTLTIIQ